MEEQFVTYKIALKLKALGFDEECFGYYTPINKMYFMYLQISFGDSTCAVRNSDFTKAIYTMSVPLWQQVVDWFREKYYIHIEMRCHREYEKDYFTYNLIFLKNSQFTTQGKKLGASINRVYYDTYEEAREQAILAVVTLLEKSKDIK